MSRLLRVGTFAVVTAFVFTQAQPTFAAVERRAKEHRQKRGKKRFVKSAAVFALAGMTTLALTSAAHAFRISKNVELNFANEKGVFVLPQLKITYKNAKTGKMEMLETGLHIGANADGNLQVSGPRAGTGPDSAGLLTGKIFEFGFDKKGRPTVMTDMSLVNVGDEIVLNTGKLGMQKGTIQAVSDGKIKVGPLVDVNTGKTSASFKNGVTIAQNGNASVFKVVKLETGKTGLTWADGLTALSGANLTIEKVAELKAGKTQINTKGVRIANGTGIELAKVVDINTGKTLEITGKGVSVLDGARMTVAGEGVQKITAFKTDGKAIEVAKIKAVVAEKGIRYVAFLEGKDGKVALGAAELGSARNNLQLAVFEADANAYGNPGKVGKAQVNVKTVPVAKFSLVEGKGNMMKIATFEAGKNVEAGKTNVELTVMKASPYELEVGTMKIVDGKDQGLKGKILYVDAGTFELMKGRLAGKQGGLYWAGADFNASGGEVTKLMLGAPNGDLNPMVIGAKARIGGNVEYGQASVGREIGASKDAIWHKITVNWGYGKQGLAVSGSGDIAGGPVQTGASGEIHADGQRINTTGNAYFEIEGR